MEISEKPSRVRQACLETGNKLRFLDVGDHQPVFGPGDGHIEKTLSAAHESPPWE